MLCSRLLVVGCSVVLPLVSSVGCKDQKQCDDAVATTRKAMQDEYLDMALARKWRDHVGKVCGQGATLTTIDQEIVAREAELTKQAAEQAQKEAADGQKAMEEAKTIWDEWDGLEAKEQDEKSLNKAKKKADRTVNGLTEAYAKQVQDFNTSRFDRRAAKLEKNKK